MTGTRPGAHAGTSTSSDIADLLERARSGDQDAFTAMVVPLLPMLHRVCVQITGHQQDAEDAVQVALLAAWRHLGRFEGRSRLSTWLHQIAANAALEQVERRVPRADEEVAETPSSAPHPDRTVADVDAVRWALGRLPPDFRAAVVLREYAGLSYQEIAVSQGVRVETVKTRIARGRQALVALLAER